MDFGIKNESVIHLVLRLRGGCFIGNSLITLSNGEKKEICEIIEGDNVLSYNVEENILKSEIVSSITLYEDDVLCQIDFEDSYIICTPSHPFYNPTEKTWKSVYSFPGTNKKNLKVNDFLLSENKNIS